MPTEGASRDIIIMLQRAGALRCAASCTAPSCPLISRVNSRWMVVAHGYRISTIIACHPRPSLPLVGIHVLPAPRCSDLVEQARGLLEPLLSTRDQSSCGDISVVEAACSHAVHSLVHIARSAHRVQPPASVCLAVPTGCRRILVGLPVGCGYGM